MNEDYERRIRNLERIVIAMSAIIGQSLNRETDDALEKACEEYFYSISEKGIEVPDMTFELPK
jgi:hypothetical protein